MVIYKATNLINGKVYIGQTKISMNERKGCHVRLAFKKGSDNHFHRSLRKYGLINFSWEVIDEAKSLDELNEKEDFWIHKYKSLNRDIGYNMKHGGNVCIFTDEVKQKIGDAQRGVKKVSEERKKALSVSMCGSGNPFYGRTHTEKTREMISESRKGKALGQTETQKQKCPHRGSENGNSNIDEQIVAAIKMLDRKGLKQYEIIKELNDERLTKTVVGNIRRGLTWRHVTI